MEINCAVPTISHRMALSEVQTCWVNICRIKSVNGSSMLHVDNRLNSLSITLKWSSMRRANSMDLRLEMAGTGNMNWLLVNESIGMLVNWIIAFHCNSLSEHVRLFDTTNTLRDSNEFDLHHIKPRSVDWKILWHRYSASDSFIWQSNVFEIHIGCVEEWQRIRGGMGWNSRWMWRRYHIIER